MLQRMLTTKSFVTWGNARHVEGAPSRRALGLGPWALAFGLGPLALLLRHVGTRRWDADYRLEFEGLFLPDASDSHELVAAHRKNIWLTSAFQHAA